MHARTHGTYEDDVSADYASLRWRAHDDGDSYCMRNATFIECGNVPSSTCMRAMHASSAYARGRRTRPSSTYISRAYKARLICVHMYACEIISWQEEPGEAGRRICDLVKMSLRDEREKDDDLSNASLLQIKGAIFVQFTQSERHQQIAFPKQIA